MLLSSTPGAPYTVYGSAVLPLTEETEIMLHKILAEKARRMTADERTYALKDVKATMALHDENSAYFAKLMAEYDALIEAMAQDCLKEYRRLYK
jgi:hypothetical protein